MSIGLQDQPSAGQIRTADDHLTDVFMGLGWCRKKVESEGFLGFGGVKEVDVDLDASCLLFDRVGKQVDHVGHKQFSSRDGAITHSGDDPTGGGGADTENERITVNLQRLDPNVQTLVFTVTSTEGEPFAAIPHAFCVLVDAISDEEIDRIDLSVEGDQHTAFIMAMVYRDGDGWRKRLINHFLDSDSPEALLPVISQYL